jgi:hypothetical protein
MTHTTLPRTVAALDADWLSDTLGATVTAVSASRIALDTGFSSELHRLTLTGDDSVPPTLIAKLPTTTSVRQAMDLVGGYAREIAFYSSVAGRAPLSTPRVYAAEIAPDSSDFVLLLEDLGDWDNASHYDGLELDRARRCIAELAALHTWSVENPDRLGAFPPLDGPVTRQVFPMLFPDGWAVYREVARRPMPSAVVAFGDDFARHVPTALEILGRRPVLIHGDIRADNLFFSGDRMAVVDFQLAAHGAGAVDLGYLVSQGLTTATRAGHDEALVREYLEHRGTSTGADFDATWHEYRAAVALFLLFPIIALRDWEQLPERARELCLRLVERSIAAIDELDALEALEALEALR